MKKIPVIKLTTHIPTVQDICNAKTDIDRIRFIVDVLQSYHQYGNIRKYKWKLDLANRNGILLEKNITKELMDECHAEFSHNPEQLMLELVKMLVEHIDNAGSKTQQELQDLECKINSKECHCFGV